MLTQTLRTNAFSSGKASCRGRRAVVVHCSAATTTAYKLNINNCVDKAHEGKSLKAITQLSPEALQGLGPKAEAALAVVNVKSIEQLGTWKLYKAAKAIAVLAATEESGKRADGAASNINGILDKAWESASLQEVLAAPPSALQGLGPKSDAALGDLGIKTVEDLGNWKYAAWADALVTLAEYEKADFSS